MLSKMRKRVTQMVKKVIYKADMFEAPATLYIDGENSVSRPCSGFVSLLLIILCIYLFVTRLGELLRGEQITSQTIHQVETNLNSLSLSNLSIGIAPVFFKYIGWVTDFKVTAQLYHYKGQQIIIEQLQMQRCKLQQWKNFQYIYNQYQMGQFMCIKNPQQVQLKNMIGEYNRSQLHIRVNNCDNNNTENITCTSTDMLPGYILWYQYFAKINYFMIFFKNTAINANKLDPIKQYIPTNHLFYYNSYYIPRVIYYLSTYIIQTDKSIWPLVQDIQIRQGYYINKVANQEDNSHIYKHFQDYSQIIFGQIIFTISPERVKCIRKIGKIDQVIAYVGGLFSVFLIGLSLILKSYNKYSYQLMISESLFNYLENGKKIKTKNFSFFKYLKYQIFNTIKFVFGKNIAWSDCKMIDETRTEANHLLNFKYFFRKMRLIQLILKFFVKQSEQKIAHLIQHPSLFEIKQKRLFMQYYDKIIQSQEIIKIHDIKSTEYKLNRLICRHSMPKILQTEGSMSSNTTKKIYVYDKQNKFKSEIKQYLFIQDFEAIQFVNKHKILYDSTKKLKISKQLQQIQVKFAKIFVEANPTLRNSILQKIPLKILFRLLKCIKKLSKEQQKYNILILQSKILKKTNNLQNGMSNQIISQQYQKNLIKIQQLQSERKVEQQCNLI